MTGCSHPSLVQVCGQGLTWLRKEDGPARHSPAGALEGKKERRVERAMPLAHRWCRAGYL